MRRRALLSTIGASVLAGCTDQSAGSEPTTPTDSDPSTPPTERAGATPTATRTRETAVDPVTEIRVSEFGSLPVSHGVSLSADGSTPELRVSVANEDDRPWALRTAHTPAPFPGASGEQSGGDAALVADVLGGPATEDGCPSGYLRQQPAFDTVRLDPGAEAAETAVVYNARGNDACWPPGAYRFEQGYTLWNGTTAYEYTWQFALVI